jgi:methyl-accepting chemotaxis protein
MTLSNLTIKSKLTTLVLIAIGVVIAICGYNLNQLSNTSMAERKAKLSAQVESAESLVQYYYQQRTALGEQTAKEQALNALKALRYDSSNYFWVIDQQHTVVMHPLKANLIGKDSSGFKDGAGKFHWQEMVRLSKTPAQKGFLDYQWKSPEGDLKDKISFVQLVPEWGWVIGSGLLVADIQETVYAQALKQATLAAIASAFLLFLGFVISKNIIIPLERLINNTHKIADGDLTVRMNMSRKDELGDMSQQIDKMLTILQETLSSARDAATRSSDMAVQIAAASEESSVSVTSQHSQLELLSTAMTEMTATISDVANNAENTAESTRRVVEHAHSNEANMQLSAQNIGKVSDDVSIANELVQELQSGVKEIAGVVKVIEDVSEQTNLLALNAAIEAARAGEQGRGFAVVADEVRNLASRTQNSTSEVQQTIERLTEQTERTFQSMKESDRHVQQSVDSTTTTQAQLLEMVTELQLANDMIAQIAAASEQQNTVATDMNENVVGIHSAANEVLQASEALAQNSQQMANSAEVLTSQLKYFKV